MTNGTMTGTIDRAGAPPADANAAAAPMGNRRRRGVLGGAVLVAVGITYLLPTLGVPNATSYLFLALGAAFASAYFTGFSPYVYLVPAATLLSFGTGLLIPAAFLGVVTLAEIFRVATVIPPGLQPLFVPAILIAVGGYLILAPRL